MFLIRPDLQCLQMALVNNDLVEAYIDHRNLPTPDFKSKKFQNTACLLNNKLKLIFNNKIIYFKHSKN